MLQLARPNIKTHRLLCSSSITPFSVSPPNPPHRGHGPPLEVLDPLHQETVVKGQTNRPTAKKRTSRKTTWINQETPICYKPSEKSWLETFTIIRHIQGETSSEQFQEWKVGRTLPLTPILFRFFHQSYRWINMAW